MKKKKRIRRRVRRRRPVGAVLLMAVFLLAAAAAVLSLGAGGVSKERKEHRMAGIEKMDAGDFSAAMAEFEAALQTAKKKPGAFETDVLKYRAEAEYKLEDYLAAAHTYETLIQVDGEKAVYLYRAALMKAMSGDVDGAIKAYQDGDALEQAQRQDKKAGEEDGEALETDNLGQTEALAAVAAACLDAQRIEDAVALYEEAILGGVTAPSVFNALGLLYLEEEHYQRALGFFEQAVQMGLENGGSQSEKEALAVQEACFNQAVVYEYMGEFETALQYFQNYVAQYGPDEAAQKEITFLQTR